MRTTKALRIMVAALAVLVVVVIAAGPALAQPTYPPSVAPTTLVPPEEQPPEVEVEQEAEGAPLAFTGAELTLLVAAFGILLAGGAVAMIAARRRSRAQHA